MLLPDVECRQIRAHGVQSRRIRRTRVGVSGAEPGVRRAILRAIDLFESYLKW